MPFPTHSKAEWLAKVDQDLKGRDRRELNFRVAGHTLTPFHHPEDLSEPPPPPVVPVRKNPVAIGVALAVTDDPAAVNRLLLDQLQKGANAVFLYGETVNPEEQLDLLLAGVHRDYVEVYLMHGDRHWSPDYALFTAHDDRPNEEVAVPAGARMLADYTRALAAGMVDRPPAFWVPVNDDYLTNIALLRALRLCVGRIDEVYGRPGGCRLIADPLSDYGDRHTGGIATTAMAAAAISGGADVVMLPHGTPDDEREETFLRRVALNVANVLHHEAHLDRVADPAAGSYYLEALTERLAESLWSAFQRQMIDD